MKCYKCGQNLELIDNEELIYKTKLRYNNRRTESGYGALYQRYDHSIIKKSNINPCSNYHNNKNKYYVANNYDCKYIISNGKDAYYCGDCDYIIINKPKAGRIIFRISRNIQLDPKTGRKSIFFDEEIKENYILKI